MMEPELFNPTRIKETKQQVGFRLLNKDTLQWLLTADRTSIHAVVTDPPYGLKEYDEEQLEKMKNGNGGVWRIPPTFDGQQRNPLPRFTTLTERDLSRLQIFFSTLAERLLPVLVPGAHVFIATNPLVSHIIDNAFISKGFEKRGAIIRQVITLRGGDRPKNAHREFPDVTVMPRSCWEPWELFRKPFNGTVAENLRRWGTGGLRRISTTTPFKDLIICPPARGREKEIAPHPTLKPQALLRRLVRASLPLGKGVVLDPFMGSGSTIAAAIHLGYQAVGIEVNAEYYRLAEQAIPQLAAL
jgi:DNA modification methylase